MLDTAAIIVIEGLWQVGKTTVAQRLRELTGAAFIQEPDHRQATTPPQDREMWYWDRFVQLEREALILRDTERKSVILERSRLSVLCYLAALRDKARLKCLLESPTNNQFSPDILVLIKPTPEHLRALIDPTNVRIAQIVGLTTIPGFPELYNQFLFAHHDLLKPRQVTVLDQSDLNRQLDRNLLSLGI